MDSTIALTDLDALVQKFVAVIPELNLTGDEQEEYSTMLLWLQNQVETGEPAEWIVDECMKYFNFMTSRSPAPADQSPSVALR
jgi:hypothetical protein